MRSKETSRRGMILVAEMLFIVPILLVAALLIPKVLARTEAASPAAIRTLK